MMAMDQYSRAKRLTEVAAAVDLTPLESGDPRYVDISEGRGTDALKKLRLCLHDHDARANRFAKIAFTGHRGCGKSTELLRLEHEVAQRFTSLHVFAEEALLEDYDYTDLFLWLVDELVRQFQDRNTPLNPKLVDNVVAWFAEVTLEQKDEVESKITLETEAELQARWGVFGNSLRLLARLKSMVIGSTARRKTIRQTLQKNSSELIDQVNLLFIDAHSALKKHGKPEDLLIVVDNLDRLPPDVSETLFFRNGDLLKRLKTHVIYTVPIATALARSRRISTVLEKSFTLPMVKVRTPQGKAFKPGLDALVQIVAGRIDTDAVFSDRRVVRRLAEMSGGNVRDLMRLVYNAQLSARVDEKEVIDTDAAKRAVLDMRLDYERLLNPAQTYYPLLARIHKTKGDGSEADHDASPERVENYRAFFRDFLFNGSVLEYNGDAMWYDVHPVIQEIKGFREALAHVEIPANPPTAG